MTPTYTLTQQATVDLEHADHGTIRETFTAGEHTPTTPVAAAALEHLVGAGLATRNDAPDETHSPARKRRGAEEE